MSKTTQAGRTEDAREIAQFSAHAARWWDREGPFAPLHQLNPVRLAWIRERIAAHKGCDVSASRPFEGLKVLDIGCGGGLLCEPLARDGAQVIGLDASAEAIAAAKAHAEVQNLEIDYRTQSLDSLGEGGERFDLILAMEVVEHVADMPAFVAMCARAIAPDGIMFAATINRTLKAFLFAIIGAEYVLRLLPRGTHHYDKLVRPEELEEVLDANRLSVCARTGVIYNPLTGIFRLSPDMEVNYMLAAISGKSGGR